MNSWCRVDAVLTLRAVTSGLGESTVLGDQVVVLHPPNFESGPGVFVVLVHGYNVSQKKGRESYARFRWWLEEFQTPAHVMELHWPGDRKWGLLSGACYPLKVETARLCGVLLAEWLAVQHADARFVLVGHSLGSRLVLEAVAELRRLRQLGRLSSVCLMAAAVPVTHVAQDLLGPQASDRARWRILYSRGDQVLRWIFPFGQSAELLLPAAVGLSGEPLHRWKGAGDAWELYQQRDDAAAPDFYGHGYYWQGGPEEPVAEERCYWKRSLRDISAPSRNEGSSAQLVAEELGARTTRRLPVRRLPPAITLRERFLPS
jgi:hypothetical protein